VEEYGRSRIVVEAEVREKREREEGATREVLREGYGWTESSRRKNKRKTRDKETNIEKTNMAKKKIERRSGRRRKKNQERSIVGVRIRIPTAIREKI